MKNKIIFTLLLLPSFLFLFSKEIYGCGSYEECPYNITNNCSKAICADCTWCQPLPTQRPEEPRENITGSIINPVLPINLSTLKAGSFLGKFIRLGISLIFIVGVIIFFFTLLSGGVRWISAGSDKTHLEGAQKQITHALVGLAILFTGFAIIQLVEHLFGISLLNITLPTL